MLSSQRGLPFYADLGILRNFSRHFDAIFANGNFSEAESTLVLTLMLFACLDTG